MMKGKWVALIFCLWLSGSVLSFGVCALTDAAEIPDWGVTLYAEDVTPTGMTLVTNQMGGSFVGTLEYDTCYLLQVQQEGTWQWVPEVTQYACPLVADSVWLQGSWREELDWQNHYGTLAAGHYRLVREFIEFADENISANLYVEFVITDQHTCRSEDTDMLCDQCLGLIKHQKRDADSDGCCDVCGLCDTYRVVGEAQWMGKWDPASNEGLMGLKEDGVYRTVFRDVPAGVYAFRVTRNGVWDGALGDQGQNFYMHVSEQSDVTVELRLANGEGQVQVYGPPIRWDEDDVPEPNPKDADLTLVLPVALLLVSAAALPFLLRRKREAS